MKHIKGGAEDMFHVHYPSRRDFFSWAELGCLTRALGFPPDLVQNHVNEEIEVDDQGISTAQLNRMMELKLLYQPLHRSFNMHTADWNICVIRKAIRLLHLSLLSFEDLRNIRVAYATYEAGDMKGLSIDQRTLLRTLKMCLRIISPKKLMHRVKHMKCKLEETNRIQLYEFFDLILWCDNFDQSHQLDQTEEACGKQNNLFNLVDFGVLLSHMDERRSHLLDENYVAEEWDFGREQLGTKHMFKGEVVYTDQRIKQTKNQKKRYRHLKSAVGQSQRRVYKAQAGSVRSRPISAPDLSMYDTQLATPYTGTNSAAAVYQSVQRRMQSAPSRESRHEVSCRPVIAGYERVHTPSVVTSNDLDDVQVKMQNLQFDIFTLESRCRLKLEAERKFYIPDFKFSEKENSGCPRRLKDIGEHRTSQVNPSVHTCDAKLGGWNLHGHQTVSTEPSCNASAKRRPMSKQQSVMLDPVRFKTNKKPCTDQRGFLKAKHKKEHVCRSAQSTKSHALRAITDEKEDRTKSDDRGYEKNKDTLQDMTEPKHRRSEMSADGMDKVRFSRSDAPDSSEDAVSDSSPHSKGKVFYSGVSDATTAGERDTGKSATMLEDQDTRKSSSIDGFYNGSLCSSNLLKSNAIDSSRPGKNTMGEFHGEWPAFCGMSTSLPNNSQKSGVVNDKQNQLPGFNTEFSKETDSSPLSEDTIENQICFAPSTSVAANRVIGNDEHLAGKRDSTDNADVSKQNSPPSFHGTFKNSILCITSTPRTRFKEEDCKKPEKESKGVTDYQTSVKIAEAERLSEDLISSKNFQSDADVPRRFNFNKATTRRLLGRVHRDISPELTSRIRSGNVKGKLVS